MPERPRSVLITGASRGLGLASATTLYGRGWRVLAAMRTPEVGGERLRDATGAAPDDPRLVAIRLDLDDPASIAAAAESVEAAVGAPDAVVHNAGIAVVGCLEELPIRTWEQVFATNFFGAVQLTRTLLPTMRRAGRGRIVIVSSQGAIRGMPAIGPYAASKGALERWAESLSYEISPFGLGVTVLVAGTFKTDILEQTETFADHDGPYSGLHDSLERFGDRFLRFAGSPSRFAAAVARSLEDERPFARRSVGLDARGLRIGSQIMPGGVLDRVIFRALRLPRPGSLREDPCRHATVTMRAPEGEARA